MTNLTSQILADRMMVEPIVIGSRHWWQPWKQEVVINMSLLARIVDLRGEIAKLNESRSTLQQEISAFQQEHCIRSAGLVWKAIEKVRWASQPPKGKPRSIPGLSLELGLVFTGMVAVGVYALA